jgi:hypothetical protein
MGVLVVMLAAASWRLVAAMGPVRVDTSCLTKILPDGSGTSLITIIG